MPSCLEEVFEDLDATFKGELEFPQAATREAEDVIKREKLENGKANYLLYILFEILSGVVWKRK